MKKIALISGDSSLSGAPTHVLQLAKGLKKAGFDPLIICPPGPLCKKCLSAMPCGKAWQAGCPVKIPCEEIPMGGPFDRRALRLIDRAIRKFDPDIAHFHGIRAGWLGLIATRRNKKFKKIYTEHLWTKNYHLRNPAYEQFQLRGLHFMERYTDWNVAVSEAVKSFLTQRGFRKDRLSVIPNGINPEFLKLNPIKKPKGLPLILGSIGSLNRVKNYVGMLKALAQVLEKDPDLDFHYQIIGEGPRRRYLEKLARRLKINHIVHFQGRVESVGERLQHISVLLNASFSESFGLAVGEAMAAGVPVIVSKIDSLKSLVGEKAGIFVNPQKPEEIAKAVVKLLKNEKLRERLGNAGKKRIEKEFSEEKMIGKTIALYQKVLKSK